ncbi:MAG TPA: metalloregulator ArsR/SmtB family transcription factor [Euzebyales bacterium]|nr:metalloregulator ArsR/SmtB family transcription factor [Euzebyales bacterium]
MTTESSAAAYDDAALRALAHPGRRRMLRLVWSAERTSTDLAEHTSMSRPSASQHLRVLRDANLVAVRVDGNRRWYRADRDRLARIRALVAGFWDDRLDALQAAAEEETQRRG